MLSFIIERAFHTDLNRSLRFIVPESTVLDFAHGLWTEKKFLVSLIVLCHPIYQLSQTVHLYPFAKLLYRKKKKGIFPSPNGLLEQSACFSGLCKEKFENKLKLS